MNLKKKLLALGLSLAMVLSLAACGQKAAEEEPAEPPAQPEEPAAETPDFTPAAFQLRSDARRVVKACRSRCSPSH